MRYLDAGLNAELGLAVSAMEMHAHSWLLTGEEVKTKAGFTKDRWTYVADKYPMQANTRVKPRALVRRLD